MISRSIQRLEESLGAKLFERSRRHVALTAAGRVFLEEAEKILLSAERAERVVQQIEAGTFGDFRLALQRPTSFGFVPRAIRRFKERAPDISVQLPVAPSHSHIELVRQGDLDMTLIIRQPSDRQGLNGLSHQAIRTYQFVALVPENWPIAAKSEIRLSDLAELPFIMFPRETGLEFYGAVMTACRAAGFTPHVVQESWQLWITMGLVAEGLGVALAPEAVDHIALRGVKHIPISDFPDLINVEVVAVWNSHRENWGTRAFIEELQRSSVDSPLDMGVALSMIKD